MRRSLLIALVSTAGVFGLAIGADDLAISPRPGILLLHNGEIISGAVTSAGDRYDVTLKDAEIHIKRADVALVCANLQECYKYKRAGIQVGRVQEHLELAEWCLRNGLIDAAEKELKDAKEADADHPKIRLVELRLKLSKETPAPREAAGSDTKTAPNEQLDRMAKSLPAGCMETFTNTVQPMLLNYCSKGGCHGSQSASSLKLHRIGISRISGRHPTQRNLQAALAMINREHPDSSPLLSAPIRAHGTAKVPIFTDREQAQYKQLVEWVYQVANVREAAPAPAPALDERGAPLLQNISRRGPAIPADAEEAGETPRGEVQPAQAISPTSNETSQAQPISTIDYAATGEFRVSRVGGQSVLRAAPKRGAASSNDFTPKDPFDPEIFNRQYGVGR